MFDRPYLTGSEVTGGEVFTTTLASSSRIERVPSVGSTHHQSNLVGEHGSSIVACDGGLTISGDGTTWRARLQLLQTLAELYGADRATVKRQ